MSGELKTYNPKQVVSTFFNQVVTGYAPGTFIGATRSLDLWDMVGGSDGEITRIKNNDRSGLVTITLQQGSASNAFLQQKVDEDERLNTGVGPLLVTDFQSATGLVSAANAFVKRIPDWGRQTADETKVEWIFACAEQNIQHGGNLLAPSLLP